MGWVGNLNNIFHRCHRCKFLIVNEAMNLFIISLLKLFFSQRTFFGFTKKSGSSMYPPQSATDGYHPLDKKHDQSILGGLCILAYLKSNFNPFFILCVISEQSSPTSMTVSTSSAHLQVIAFFPI